MLNCSHWKAGPLGTRFWSGCRKTCKCIGCQGCHSVCPQGCVSNVIPRKIDQSHCMTHWLQVFKFPSVERINYDRCECTAEHQIYPLIGDKLVGDITAADLKEVLNHWMNEGYAYTTVKKAHVLLNEFFRYLTQQEILVKNPITDDFNL